MKCGHCNDKPAGPNDCRVCRKQLCGACKSAMVVHNMPCPVVEAVAIIPLCEVLVNSDSQ